MKNILYIITGAAGHLAGTILRILTGRNCLVRGLLLPGEDGIAGDNITYITGDVTKPETLDPLFANTGDAEVVVLHCAGIISIQKKVSPAVWRVNVTGTRNILAKCKQYGVRRLVYVSSVHALPEARGTLIREIDRFSPDAVNGAYAKTKAEATQAVLDAAKSGLDAVVVHPSGIIGPFDRYESNHIVQMMRLYLRRRLPAGVRGGYDFVDVRDAAEGVLLAAQKGRRGECYILSNRYVPMREILEEMRICTGRKRRLPLMSYSAARLFAPLCEWYAKITHTRSIYTAYSIKTLAGEASFCHDKATEELGYHTRSFKETIRDTLAYLQQNTGNNKQRPSGAACNPARS